MLPVTFDDNMIIFPYYPNLVREYRCLILMLDTFYFTDNLNHMMTIVLDRIPGASSLKKTLVSNRLELERFSLNSMIIMNYYGPDIGTHIITSFLVDEDIDHLLSIMRMRLLNFEIAYQKSDLKYV